LGEVQTPCTLSGCAVAPDPLPTLVIDLHSDLLNLLPHQTQMLSRFTGQLAYTPTCRLVNSRSCGKLLHALKHHQLHMPMRRQISSWN